MGIWRTIQWTESRAAILGQVSLLLTMPTWHEKYTVFRKGSSIFWGPWRHFSILEVLSRLSSMTSVIIQLCIGSSPLQVPADPVSATTADTPSPIHKRISLHRIILTKSWRPFSAALVFKGVFCEGCRGIAATTISTHAHEDYRTIEPRPVGWRYRRSCPFQHKSKSLKS